MRAGLIVSGIAHVTLIAWGVISVTSAPLDASNIEQIPVDFVQPADNTQLTKGLETAALTPAPKPVDNLPPLPKPEPKVQPAPQPQTPEPPTSEPPPLPPPPPPQADQTPPAVPVPDAATPPPPDQTAAAPLKDVPMPRVRPKMPPAKSTASELDRIQQLLDKRKLDEMASAAATDQPATAGSPDAPSNVKMTASELEMLRARLARCWNPPLGWSDPSEVRVVLMLSLNSDGTVSGQPKVLEAPQGQYASAAPESAIRAVLRCAPYNLPVAKYDAWKEVKVTFDPRDMGAT